MTESSPLPEPCNGEPYTRDEVKVVTPPPGPLDPSGGPPAGPATTSDFERFPEQVESPEVTSLLRVGDTRPYPPGKHPQHLPHPQHPHQPHQPQQGPAAPSPSPSLSPLYGSPDASSDVPAFDPQIELKRRLGAGGMGEVFLGLQKHLGREVAVKRIREWGEDASTKERFIQEAKAQARLQHPGIAQVYDLRETRGGLYLIMEYVPGTTLHEVLAKEGKLPPEEIVSIGVQLTEALEAAAHEGYIHRDLKPANVMLTAGGPKGSRRVKIIDFGLALRFRNLLRTRLTEKGDLIGTPAYMSPEQLNQDEHLDIRSDIWALGILLYTLATGEPPFTGRDFVCTVKNVMMSEPLALTDLEKGFPTGLWKTIYRAIQKNRDDRWQDYASFRHALLHHTGLSGLASAEAIAPKGSVALPPARPSSLKGRRRRAALLGAALLVALGIVALLRYGPFPAETPPELGSFPAQKVTEAAPAVSSNPASRPDPSKALLTTPRESPAPAVIKKPGEKPKEIASPPEPAGAPLREKLAGYALSEEDSAFVREVLDLLGKERPQLQSKNFKTLQAQLQVLERDRLGLAPGAAAPPGKEYRAAQVRAASRMANLAEGALRARLEELKVSKDAVSVTLSDGTTKSRTTATGIVQAADLEKGLLTLATPGGGRLEIPLESFLPESLRGEAAPATARLALLGLSGASELSFREILDLSETREEVLFWVPLALRMARLDLEAAAGRVAKAKKENPGILPNASPIMALSARVGVLAGTLRDRKVEILRTFQHLGSEFSLAEREAQAFGFLMGDAFGKVLALGPGTASFPVAAEILLERFESDLKNSHDELHAQSGWHAYGWRLFPPEPSLKEQEKYWDLDAEGKGSILQAADVERRLVMGKGAKRAPEGLLLRVGFTPKEAATPSSHWRLLLRGREGAPTYLRFDGVTCALYRTRLASGERDLEIARAPLPAPQKAGEPYNGEDRLLALLPIEGNLHLMVDGRHVLALPEAEAGISMQLSFAVTQGKLAIKSIRTKKAPPEESQER